MRLLWRLRRLFTWRRARLSAAAKRDRRAASVEHADGATRIHTVAVGKRVGRVSRSNQGRCALGFHSVAMHRVRVRIARRKHGRGAAGYGWGTVCGRNPYGYAAAADRDADPATLGTGDADSDPAATGRHADCSAVGPGDTDADTAATGRNPDGPRRVVRRRQRRLRPHCWQPQRPYRGLRHGVEHVPLAERREAPGVRHEGHECLRPDC